MRTVYFDTSMFVEMGAKKSKHSKNIKELLAHLKAEKNRIYTSMISVQELSVAVFRKGTIAKDVYGDINSIARVYGITKEVAMTAGKCEATLKDLAEEQHEKRDSKIKTRDEELEDICENRRRKWDCFHIAAAQQIGCKILYSTDAKMQNRPAALGIKTLDCIGPAPAIKTIKGPLLGTEDTGLTNAKKGRRKKTS